MFGIFGKKERQLQMVVNEALDELKKNVNSITEEVVQGRNELYFESLFKLLVDIEHTRNEYDYKFNESERRQLDVYLRFACEQFPDWFDNELLRQTNFLTKLQDRFSGSEYLNGLTVEKKHNILLPLKSCSNDFYDVCIEFTKRGERYYRYTESVNDNFKVYKSPVEFAHDYRLKTGNNKHLLSDITPYQIGFLHSFVVSAYNLSIPKMYNKEDKDSIEARKRFTYDLLSALCDKPLVNRVVSYHGRYSQGEFDFTLDYLVQAFAQLLFDPEKQGFTEDEYDYISEPEIITNRAFFKEVFDGSCNGHIFMFSIYE